MFEINSKKNKNSLAFYCDSTEYSGVQKIAQKVAADVKKVLGINPSFVKDYSSYEHSVIFGTIGQSTTIDSLSSKINLETIEGKRECFIFKIIGTDLVIAGSDKRGTIYGLFHLSKLLGVSALVNWADVVPAKKDKFTLTEKDNYISEEPSVRFRGFFINDEWPAFGNWCNKRFGGFNSKCYEQIFELLLRMKGNYLWPAMWSATFSEDGPGLLNAELADELGVVMGASHHEPCCRAGEEYKHLRGKNSIYGDAWNFRTNEKGITKFWEDGLKRNGKFENVITVGMRGEADTAIMKNATLKDNIDLLRDVLKTQNRLIKQYVNEDLDKVPRMLALYKEVEPYFYGDKHTKGLMNDPQLDGVTLMLCDDNHGNLRTVPTEKMRNHKGGYGMYYHFDYHGWPFSYEWFNTNHISKAKEQLSMAYDFGVRDLWIVNVGDVMTNEFPMSFFFDLAYDYKKYSSLDYSVVDYTNDWVDFQFAQLKSSQKKMIAQIINDYTRLTHKRRTECLEPLTYHPVNFGESDRTLEQAEKIISDCEKLKKEILKSNKELWTGFFSQVYLPAVANMNILRMQLYSGKNIWFAKHGGLSAKYYASKVKECFEFDKNIVLECDTVAKGKWYAMGWSEHFGFKNWCEAENRYPVYVDVEPSKKQRIFVWMENSDFTTTGQDWTQRDIDVNQFKNPDVSEVKIFIADCSEKQCKLTVQSKQNQEWMKYCVVKGSVPDLRILKINVNRELLAKSKNKKDVIVISGNDGFGGNISVNIKVDAEVPSLDYPKNTFIQTDDYICMEAAHFTYKSDDDSWKELCEYGKTLSAMKAYPVEKTFKKQKEAPCLSYNFVVQKAGSYSIDFYTNPSNPVYKDNKLCFAASVNGKNQMIDAVPPEYAVGDNQFPWGSEVANNIRIVPAVFNCKEGLNTLEIRPVTPGFVLEKIVIYYSAKAMPESYLGAPETKRV